jgi:proline racemase
MRLDNLIHVVTAHCEGIACDVVVGGMPRIPGESALAKKRYFEEHLDHLRTMLVLEPRGTEVQCANVLVPSGHPDAAFGVLILEKDGLVDMSGGNIISVATVLLETGLVASSEPVTEFNLETPAGLVGLSASVRDGKVLDVTFTNQPAFPLHRDRMIDVPGIGRVRVDIAWGGMWYVIVEAADLGLQLHPREHKAIIAVGEQVREAAGRELTVRHPGDPDLAATMQGTIITGPLEGRPDGAIHSRNAAVIPPGWIDRCPCGTGTCARMSVLHARGELATGQRFVHESLIGTQFIGRIVEEVHVGGVPAIVPTVTGRAWITGTAQRGVDPTDPFPHGYSMEALAAGEVAIRGEDAGNPALARPAEHWQWA